MATAISVKIDRSFRPVGLVPRHRRHFVIMLARDSEFRYDSKPVPALTAARILSF